jgi:hypothetical protein
MKQTGVEWLISKLTIYGFIAPSLIKEEINQAKEIEEQLIVEAFTDGTNYNKAKGIVITPDEENYSLGKQYYNETFKK